MEINRVSRQQISSGNGEEIPHKIQGDTHMTIFELTPTDFVDIIKALINSNVKPAGVDLEGFLNKTKEQFAEAAKPFHKEAATDEFEEKTGDYGKCCLPHNHAEIRGVVTDFRKGEGVISIGVYHAPNSYIIYLKGNAKLFCQDISRGDTISVTAHVLPNDGDSCRLYVYDPHDIKKLSPKENPSHD